MRKLILNLHLYAGLLCAPYLVIFGISSLHFNHQFEFAKPRTEKREWEAPLTVALPPDNLKAAEQVRDSLGMIGWPLPWDMSRDPRGNLRFGHEHPGKSYKIHVLSAEKKVRVEERPKGFWPVVNGLHGLMEVPNSRFASAWGAYTEICTYTVLFAGISGIYLWLKSKRERMAGIVILAGGATAALGLMLYIVLRG